MHKLDRGIREFQARKIDSDSTDHCGLIKIQQSAKNFAVPIQLIIKTAKGFVARAVLIV